MEIYETLFIDAVANCEDGDLIEFDWINEDGDPMVDRVRIQSISVETSEAVVKGYSEVTGETTTYGLDPDLHVKVLGG